MDDGGQAFPRACGQCGSDVAGMSLQDWFAGKAMQALAKAALAEHWISERSDYSDGEKGETTGSRDWSANEEVTKDGTAGEVAFAAYELADAMLRERARRIHKEG